MAYAPCLSAREGEGGYRGQGEAHAGTGQPGERPNHNSPVYQARPELLKAICGSGGGFSFQSRLPGFHRSETLALCSNHFRRPDVNDPNLRAFREDNEATVLNLRVGHASPGFLGATFDGAGGSPRIAW